MAERRIVSRGLPMRVRARFTRDGHPRRGVLVRFFRRVAGQRDWHLVGHARTNRRGRATITRMVHRSAVWRTRVPAHDGHPAVTSNVLHAHARSLGASAVRVAATRRGDPYRWGADGPHRFDCSGLTRWVFERLGRSLPHNSAAQYGRVRHVERDHKRVGDLIFFHDGGGHVFHVGIYAGHGYMWHAPHSGTRVRKQRIFSRAYYVGRV
jgi:cell wall-associated NlpC family hydrolase